jgi:hypothetical protein
VRASTLTSSSAKVIASSTPRRRDCPADTGGNASAGLLHFHLRLLQALIINPTVQIAAAAVLLQEDVEGGEH